MKAQKRNLGCAYRALESRPGRLCEKCACSICAELRGSLCSFERSRIPTTKSRILHQDNDWVVIPSLGPLTAGHVMLVPRTHYYSILSCPEEVLNSSQNVLEECTRRLTRLYKQGVLIFEHGATKNHQEICGACIEHAHLHISPGPISFITSATSRFGPWIAADSLADLRSKVRGSSYLMVGSLPENKYWFYRCTEQVPSQFLRQILATELKNEASWDWRLDPNVSAFLQTLTDWTL